MFRTAILLLTCLPLAGQQYTISTVAGRGVAGLNLNNPEAVAIDAAGNLYVGDWSGFIHKVFAAGGSMIFAGTGVATGTGFGGQATNASIGRGQLAIDADGNLFLADEDFSKVRRIDAVTGAITSIATPGLSQPTGIVLDHSGNIYVSSNWSKIEKVSVSTGAMQTVAGQFQTSFGGDDGPATNALFWDPVPSALDLEGNLVIADYENSRIRRIDLRTGIVSTIGGSGTCAPSGAPGMNVIVCQSGFSGDGGPATSALLNHAQSVAIDAAGNLYLSDTINHRIRRVDAATGMITTPHRGHWSQRIQRRLTDRHWLLKSQRLFPSSSMPRATIYFWQTKPMAGSGN